MLVRLPFLLRLLLCGLGCTVLLQGLGEGHALGLGVVFAALLLAMAPWRMGGQPALAGVGVVGRERGEALPQVMMARLVQGETQSSTHPARGQVATLPVTRTFWARVKLWVGGVGFVLSGLWWLLLAAMLFMPDPAPALDGIFTSYSLTLVTVSLLITMLFVVVLRSGLRGPSDPLAPDRGDREPRRKRGEATRPDSHSDPLPSSGKKPHLRLVRNAR